jgi:hypothetical protein
MTGGQAVDMPTSTTFELPATRWNAPLACPGA